MRGLRPHFSYTPLARVEALLRDHGPLTNRQIAKRLGITTNAAHLATWRLRRLNRAAVVGTCYSGGRPSHQLAATETP